MKTNPGRRFAWRVAAFIAVVLNIGFSYLSNARIVNGQNNADVSARYPTLFTPAGYAFSVWGLIYLGLIAYSVYQLLPARRGAPIHDRLAKPLVLASILSIVWLVLFNSVQLLLSVAVIVGMLTTALLLLVRSREGTLHEKGWNWLAAPFSLYAGWLTVATIANVAVYLTSIGWLGNPLGPVNWTLVMISTAVLIALLVSWRLRDVVFPLVVAWASLAIWVARRQDSEPVALTALAAAILMTAWSVLYSFTLIRNTGYRANAGV